MKFKCLLSVLFSSLLFSTFSQEYYVKIENLDESTGNEGKEYHYTKSVTLKPGFVANSANGPFTIKSIPFNSPPSLDQNFVRVEVPKVPVSSENDLTLLTPDDKSVTFSYSDGLGRPTMSSAAAAGPNYADVVQYNHYDQTTGRADKGYLPYVKNHAAPGQFISDAKTSTENYYNSPPSSVTQDSKPFSYNEYDSRGRVSATVAPGANWHTGSTSTAKKTTYDYFMHDPSETNAAEDFTVIKWKISNGKPVTSENYIANELSVVLVTDPQGRKMRTVKDMRGLTITSQVFDATAQKWYGSYNVYDEMGRVRFVVPPILTADLTHGAILADPSTTQIDELLFEYKYDNDGRIIQQKAPGAGWEYFVYDEWDRLVMSRHQGQQWNGGDSWTFYKYDAWNRQIMTGVVRTNDDRDDVIAKVSGKARYETETSSSIGYVINNSFPRLTSDYSNYEIRTINYYDDYSFKTSAWAENLSASAFNRVLPSGFTGTQITDALSLATGSKVRILDATGSNQWLNTVIYYDEGTDVLTNQLEDWTGELEKMLLEHNSTTDQVDILTEYEYAHNGQLIKTFQTIDGGTRVEVADYKYNVLGELVEKNLHSTNGTSYLQSVDYRYNIQGALTAINDPNLSTGGDNDLFGMKYHYETSIGIANTEDRYDGLVNTMEYNATNRTSSVVPTDGPNGQTKTALGFDYDERNRLKGTSFAQGNSTGSTYDQKVGDFNMTASYDANGNIDDLTRKSDDDVIDDLNYTYSSNSNKLTAVDDTAPNEGGLDDYYPGTDYTYDAMGNMTSDANKQITDIFYNEMQLVDEFLFLDQTSISYIYDAVGNRLAKTVVDGDGNELSRVDYVGMVEYLDDEINQIFTDEGRAYKQNNAYHYEYFITDHQGNNRVAFGNLPERNVYVATMETPRSSYETSEFAFPDNNNPVSAENHTPLGEKSMALNGTNVNKRVGPMKVIKIATHDKVEIEVFAKYSGSFSNGAGGLGSSFLDAFNDASAGSGAEGAGLSVQSMLADPALFQANDNSSNEPEAYLQYIFFDESYSFESQGSGFKPVTNNSNGKFFKLSSGELSFSEPGYLLVYVANESQNSNKDVFFDDLKITHASSESAFRVTQVNDYYPFGLPTANSWRAPGYVDPGLLYQSSYSGLDSLTGYYDFLSRSYDPVLGRFFAVDPAGQFSNPYNGMGNAPHMMIDPTGEIAWFVPLLIGGAMNLGTKAISGDVNNFWDGLKHFAIGAATSAVTQGITFGVQGAIGGHGFGTGVNAAFSNSGLARSIISDAVIPGIIPQGFVQAGLNVTTNGIANAFQGNNFFEGAGFAAGAGFISGGIQGAAAAKVSEYERSVLFGTLTQKGREDAFMDIANEYDIFNKGVDNVTFSKLDNAYGEVKPISPTTGKRIEVGTAAGKYPQGVKSEYLFDSSRGVSLKKIRANIIHEVKHAKDLNCNIANIIHRHSTSNDMFQAIFEIRAHREVLNFGIQRSYNRSRIAYWMSKIR